MPRTQLSVQADIAAKLYLDANPDGYTAVRLILGHSKESRTIDAYAGLDGIAAARAFDEIVSTRRGGRE